jgi:hypothetical protein
MKSLVYLITSSEESLFELVSDGAFCGEGGEGRVGRVSLRDPPA